MFATVFMCKTPGVLFELLIRTASLNQNKLTGVSIAIGVSRVSFNKQESKRAVS